MLKTLRVTSFVAVVLASCGAVAMFFMGLKGNPEVKAFLDSPGIVERFKDKAKNQDKKESKTPPLVAQAQAFALRIDPPPPKPKVDTRKKPIVKAAPPKPKLPKPKVKTTVKSNLIATVLYKSSPERSLALLETTGGKQEWFRQGEKVGHLEIQEIRDGSVVFTQGGRNPQEKFVPAKPTKSLLKGEQTTPAALPAVRDDTASTHKTGSDSPRIVRPLDRTSRPRADVSKRIQRARSVPAQPSPQEKKQSIDKTISGIEAIMSRQEQLVSEDQQEKGDAMWEHLLEKLNAEKKKLAAETESEEVSEEDTEKTETDSPEENTEKKAEDANESPASEPNEPE
ncbi:MAG: hypothetical protein ACYSU8_08775 [Planctomycetota bacterium]|jgi:hypothetical protein